MHKKVANSLYSQSPKIRKLRESIVDTKEATPETSGKIGQTTAISGLIGSSLSMVLAETFRPKQADAELPFLLILDDKEEAAYHLNDLENLLGDQHVMFYPGSYRRPYHPDASGEETDNANILLRSEVLNRINSRKKPAFIVTYPEALFEKVVTRKELERNTLKISVNDQLSIDFVNEVLFEYRFKRTDFVTEPGEFSVRGGILDVFSFSNDEPFRIEFFGDEVDSIRTFDVETQLSIEQKKKVSIIPNIDSSTTLSNRMSFFDYIAAKTVVFIKNEEIFFSAIDNLFEKATEAFSQLNSEVRRSEPAELFCTSSLLQKQLKEFTTVSLTSKGNRNLKEVASETPLARGGTSISFSTRPQPSFNKQFNLLIENLNENTDNGYKNYIFCSSEQQAKRFQDIFEDAEQNVEQFETIVFPLFQGFIDDDLKVVCYTDHQIFERYHKFSLKNGYAKKQAITIKEITNLEVGDYVTHIDHGIGKFGGLQKIDVEGKMQEAIL